ncbi:putative immunity protein [Kitasatospora indigofera]|uniref:putative immunity protein n=1 Tax=Kitasatospora indigofera TaxID=67307 RepID=UPI00367D331C
MDEVIISEEDRRQLGAWAADCAERVLHLFEADAPADTRPREAIEGIRSYARGEIPRGPLRPLAHAALAAAREAGAPAATAAARAAGYAAATPYIHALASPHQSNHVLAPAVQTARARELAAGEGSSDSSGTGTGDGDVDSSGDLEIRRAIEHAPPAVRGILAQLPACGPGRSRAEVLRHRLDAALRD